MLQDAIAIRHYQKITDSLVEMSERGYRTTDEMRLFLDGYLSALRITKAIEIHHIHRLEEEVIRFLYDTSNFESPYEFEMEVERGDR
ncbi:hypothetical protein H6F44_00995 [Pseudanabaena sp. FACHB-1277]|jgi:hypothetical protein|uniref:Uncharacterized protein n=1 Tax=Pseudanabaena cinerea FACHB-1277 TaxID=2949581 RepID=A0A926UPA7_9CYAN|nr:DUF6761 family protein [Pseudanabaena cinerea]MBD2148710.1 hypothetical protein [Pseudanabaena cinerea FACHB-1277]